MSEKRFVQCEIEYGFANTTNIKKIDGIYDMQEEKTYRIEQIVDLLNEQQKEIDTLKDDVYDELDKALKILEEIYEDYPKNNVQRLYNNLKGLKEMIR